MIAIGQLVKIILGALVVVAVVLGIGFYFRDSVIGFFRGLPGNETSKLILGLLK